MKSVEVKAIESRDFDLWLPLWKNYQRFYEVEIDEAVTIGTWTRFLNPNEPMHAFLAMIGDRAMGLAHTIYHRSTWTMDDNCYLQDLFVEGSARGFGVGRTLIEHVYADAENRGASRVYWSTQETNHVAMELYDRIADRSGFIVYRKALG
jgi:hypothetical protein